MNRGTLPEHLINAPVNWGPLGRQIFERTYSHDIRDESGNKIGKESWLETVVRAVDGNLGLVDERFIEADEREKLIDLLFRFDALPAGRHLNASGLKGRQFLFNCHNSHYDPKEPWAHFTFLFDQLMQGGGVGANYSNRYLTQMPLVSSAVDLHLVCNQAHPNYSECVDWVCDPGNEDVEHNNLFVVPDSREGWVEAIEHILKAAFSGSSAETRVVVDVSAIRARGLPLKTSGGVACGPGPLVEMLYDFVQQLNGCVGRKLKSLDVMTLDHVLASCVIAGGKRRSSRMSVKNWRDQDIFEFIHCKRTDGTHWTTNISVEVDGDFLAEYASGNKHALAVMRAVILGKRTNGEPGLWNRSLSMQGERNPEDVVSPNPCVTGDTRVMTERGLIQIKDLVGKEIGVAIDRRFGEGESSRTTEVGAFRTGTQSILRLDTVEGHQLRLTPDHKVMTTTGWKKAKDLQADDLIHIANTKGAFGPKGSQDLGLLAGWITGDGCLLVEENNTPRLYFYGDDRHLLEPMLDATERVTGVRPSYSVTEVADRLQFQSAALREFLGGLLNDKFRVPEFVWQGTEVCQRAYLSALFSADGGVQGVVEKGITIRLASSKPNLLRDVQTLLLNFGIASKIYLERREAGYRDMPDGRGGYESYFCEADHELVIAKANLLTYAEEIGFIHEDKQRTLQCVVSEDRKRGFYREAFTARVLSLVPDGTADVYDVTVPTTHSFIANGLVVHNCGEIGLHPWENCNLSHVNMENFAKGRKDDMLEALRLMARWAVRATYGDIPQARQRAVVDRNRRIGIGFFGYHGWLALNGIKYSESYKNLRVIRMMQQMHAAVVDGATAYANQMGIPVPIKFTTLAPTGTTAGLPGTTTSGQALMAKWFKRLVRYSDMDPQVSIKRLEGYEVFRDEDAKNTDIVVYWCEDPLVAKVRNTGFDPDEILEDQSDISFEDALNVQKMFQTEYCDNAVSFTVNLEPDRMPSEEEMERILIDVLPYLKGTTAFPNKSRKNAPIQPLTQEQFDAYTGRKEVTQVEDQCLGGCPVK